MAVTSFQPNKTRLFARKDRQGQLGLLSVFFLAIFLMFADSHYKELSFLRSSFALVTAPIQYTVDYPLRLLGGIQALFNAKKALIDENIKLRYEQTLLEAELQKLLLMREENSQLRELLLTRSTREKTKTMAGQILAVDSSTARQIVILNKGKRNGVHVGQPVLDAKGVMGQVIDVGHMTSTVLLISDAKSAVPVRNNRTGECAILIGNNSLNQLTLINLPRTSSVKKGDLLVTSGLGRLYPEGYPVGRVEAVKNMPGEAFIKVEVSPVALLNRNRLVLLIWPDKDQEALTAQINERIDAVGKIG